MPYRTWPMTDGECLRAQRLRANGMAWEKIAFELGVSTSKLKNALDPEFRLRQAKKREEYRLTGIPFSRESRPEAPQRVLDERDRRMALEHKSLTASWFKDPLPGYSALDKKRAAFNAS